MDWRKESGAEHSSCLAPFFADCICSTEYDCWIHREGNPNICTCTIRCLPLLYHMVTSMVSCCTPHSHNQIQYMAWSMPAANLDYVTHLSAYACIHSFPLL